MKILQRWPLSSREDHENNGDMWEDPNLDSLVQPLLVDAVEAVPDRVRLFADGMHLTVQILHEVNKPTTLYTLPVHVRERLIDRLRFAALVYQHLLRQNKTELFSQPIKAVPMTSQSTTLRTSMVVTKS